MGIAEDIARLERRLEALKIEYEHYFSGRIRLEPCRLREEMQRSLARWIGKPINNTMYKFRYQNLVARFNVTSAYWNRCLQQIEEGTFKRDTFRMQLHDRERRERDQRRQRLDAIISAREGRPGGGELYQEFLAARSACGLDAGEVAREAFDAFLERQREQLRGKLGCEDVDFKVSVEDCKVRLVAKPVRGGRKG